MSYAAHAKLNDFTQLLVELAAQREIGLYVANRLVRTHLHLGLKNNRKRDYFPSYFLTLLSFGVFSIFADELRLKQKKISCCIISSHSQERFSPV